MRDEADDRLEVVTRWGGGDEPRGLVAGRGRAAGKRGGARARVRRSRSSATARRRRRDALAALPLAADARRARAALARASRPRASSSDEDRAFLAACAGQCGQALERAQLHERTAVAAARSAFHARASQALDEVQGFSERAQRLLELVVEHVGGLAWIELREDDERLVAVAGADGDGTPGDELLSRPRGTLLSADAARAVEDALARGNRA